MKITKHAQERINERNVKIEDLVDTLVNGVKMVNRHDSNKWTFRNKNQGLYIVTDKAMETVVTVFWGN